MWCFSFWRNHRELDVHWLMHFNNACRRVVFSDPNLTRSAESVQNAISVLPENDLIDLVSYLLSQTDSATRDHVEEIDSILVQGGSGWRVGVRSERYSLVRRLPEGITDIAESVVNHDQRSSRYLKEAWDYAFMASPDPSNAYQAAIKAVESVARELVAPRNGKANLASCAKEIREGKGKWSFAMADSPHRSGVQVVHDMLDLFINAQTDRHPGQVGHAEISEQSAQAAVLMATTLVGWFTMEHFERADDSQSP